MRIALYWPLISVSVAILFLLAACGGSEATPTPRPTAKPEPTATPTPGDTPTVTPTVVQPSPTAALTPTPTPVPPMSTATLFPTPRVTSTLDPDTESVVHLVSQDDCGENQVCYFVSVECNGLAPREAQVRVSHLNDSKGAVVFTTGGWGVYFYANRYVFRGGLVELPGRDHPAGQTVEKMRLEGYETYEVNWAGERGWGTDNFGQGLKKAMCGYAELVRWVATKLADNPDVMGATGASAGSWQIGYGLALYGLEDILDVVVLTGGGLAADMVEACKLGGRSSLTTLWDGLIMATIVNAFQQEVLSGPSRRYRQRVSSLRFLAT